MAWERANSTQQSLAAAEQHFLNLCDTDEEVDDDTLEEAEQAMRDAAMEADEALNEIRAGGPGWESAFARILR